MTDAIDQGGFTDGALVPGVTQDAILEAIVAKIQDNIAPFQTEANCFITDRPMPSVEISDNLFCTVCPRDGDFDVEEMVGGGVEHVREYSTIQITVWSRIETDQLDRSARAWLDPKRGILPLKREFLKTLAGQQLYSDAPENQLPMLVTHLMPTRCQHPPSEIWDDEFTSFSMSFTCQFNWDLS